MPSHSSMPDRTGRTPRRAVLLAAVILVAVAAVAAITQVGSVALSAGAARSSQADLGASVVRPTSTTAAAEDTARRTAQLSRSADRVAESPAPAPVPAVTGKLWTTAPLNLRVAPRDDAKVDGVFDADKMVAVTGQRQGGFAQVLVGPQTDVVRWVTASYLSQDRAPQPGSMGLVDKPCPGTSGVENGLTSGAVRVYRAVCNNFPQITQYGGYAPRGEHADGKAIDVMTTDVALGNEIAAFLQAHAAELDLYDIIWRQHIWTPVRSSEGWRMMPDRGDATANHMNHVHVAVN